MERGGARAIFWARDVLEGQRAIRRHTQVALDAPNASADDAAPQTQHEGKQQPSLPSHKEA